MPRDGFAWVVDVAQLVGAIIGVVAIVLAVVANRNARRAETRSRDALVRERRIDFQLDLLKELAEHNLHGDNVSMAGVRFTLVASLLPADLIPIARAAAWTQRPMHASGFRAWRRNGEAQAHHGSA